MARVSIFWHAGAGALYYYNLEAGVGQGRPNQRSDVLLVQYFLREAVKVPQLRGGYTAPPVDGIASQQTFAAILGYQKIVNQNFFGSLLADSRVDPIPGDRMFWGKANHEYSIISLNSLFKMARGLEVYRDLSSAADLPGELREPLTVQAF